MQLVECKKSDVYADSNLVARKLGQQHKEVVKRIERLCSDLRGVSNPPKFPIREQRNYRGRDYTAYLMTREFFSLLAMRFKGKKALEWQIKFNDAFYAMEVQLIRQEANNQNDMWLATRQQVKLIRHDTTDVIKEFVDYATEQGSKNANFYYKHITNATYRALGVVSQGNPKIRETLDLMTMSSLATAEGVVQRSLRKHMDDKIPYKKIYDFVKDDIDRYADGLMLEGKELK